MAKITEKSDKKGDFFKTNDIVGIPFEIWEDVNASSDFRETKKRELKDGETEKQPYQIIDINCNGETKEWHLTMSALRSLRNAMSPGMATWKGQRCVVNSLAAGFTPTKITRLMGDYAMPKDQQQLGQEPAPVAPPVPQISRQEAANLGEILTPIYEKLKYGATFFKGGLIPSEDVQRTCITPANFQSLKDKGMLCEPVQGFFQVT